MNWRADSIIQVGKANFYRWLDRVRLGLTPKLKELDTELTPVPMS